MHTGSRLDVEVRLFIYSFIPLSGKYVGCAQCSGVAVTCWPLCPAVENVGSPCPYSYESLLSKYVWSSDMSYCGEKPDLAEPVRRLFKRSHLYPGVEPGGVIDCLSAHLSGLTPLSSSVSSPLHRVFPVPPTLHGLRTRQGNFQVWEAGDSPTVTQLVAGEEPEPNPAGSKFQSHCILDGKGQLEMLKNGEGTRKWTYQVE